MRLLVGQADQIGLAGTLVNLVKLPQARLVPLAVRGERRAPANAMRIRRIAADFDAPDPAIEALFGGEDA
jgi:hypothetical protein